MNFKLSVKGLQNVHDSQDQWERLPKFRSYSLKTETPYCFKPSSRK